MCRSTSIVRKTQIYVFTGSGAIAGNSMGIDREFLAKELGFKNGASLNSINSTGNRDAILDFLFASSATFLGNI